MAITTAGFTGTVDQVDFAQILGAVADHGVVGEYNDTSMSAAKVSGSRTMLVQPGYVYAPGVMGHLDAAANATAAGALSGSNPRIDVLVARFDWSTMAMTLVMKAGTQAASPVPPALTQTPGTLFEVPLRQGMLTSASSSEYVASSVEDRRYWVEGGKYVLADATQLPPGKVGAVAVRPDTKQIVVKSTSGWDTYKSESDTGWGVTSIPAPGGFTGSVWGHKYNGIVELQFEWTKQSTPTASNAEFGITIPSPYRPGGKAVDKVLIAGGDRVCRLYILPSGSANIGPMTLNAGDTIRGHLIYVGQ